MVKRYEVEMRLEKLNLIDRKIAQLKKAKYAASRKEEQRLGRLVMAAWSDGQSTIEITPDMLQSLQLLSAASAKPTRVKKNGDTQTE